MIKNKSIALLIAICFIVIIFCIGAYNDTSLYWYFPHEVGIFIANPSSELHVAGTTPEVRIGDDDAEDTSLIFMGNAKDMYIALDDTTDDLTIGEGTTIGSNVRMVIENGGNVGIGTITPDKQLDVTIADDTSGVGAIFQNSDGHITLTNGTASSNQFAPNVSGLSTGNGNPGITLLGKILTADDSGTTAVTKIISKQNDNTVIDTRPLLSIGNHTTEYIYVDTSGDIIHRGTYNYGSDTGSTDDYAITFTPALTEYIVGLPVYFRANTANDGACSLNINGLGAKALKSLHDQDPAANYIEVGSVVHCIYQDTNVFQILSPDANP